MVEIDDVSVTVSLYTIITAKNHCILSTHSKFKRYQQKCKLASL